MKKSPANKKTKKKVVTTSNNAAEKKRSVKVYRKDGTLKSETTSRRGNAGFDKKGVYKGSTKKETRYTGSPRTLKTKAVEVDVKDASTRSYTKYKKDGTVKKQLKSTNIPGQGGDSKKIARKGRRDAKGAQTVSAKAVDVKRSPAKKPLVGKQKSLPKELQQAILKSPGKMLSKSAIKMMDKSPMNMKTPMKKSKQKVEQDYARNAIADYKSGKTKEAKYEKKKALEVAAGESMAKMKKPVKKTKTTTASGSKVKAKLKKGTIKVKSKPSREAKKEGAKGRKFVMNTEGGSITLSDPNKYKSRRAAKKANAPSMMKDPKMKKKTTKSVASIGEKSYGKKVTRIGGNKTKTKEVYSEPGYSEIKKSKTKKDNVGYTSTKNSKKVIQRERPGKKAAKKMIRKGASTVFESRMGSAIMMKTNQSGGGYAAKNPAAPARQLKKLGSILSKHMKSN